MDEEKIVIQSEENENIIDVENIELNVEHKETAEYIEVDYPEDVVIEIEESFGAHSNTDGVTHYGLPDRNDPNQHNIGAITGLRKELDVLGKADRGYYSRYSGFAEFRPWKTDGEVGRFVSLVYQNESDPITGGNIFINICDNNNQEVYGVTVGESAFCGYQNLKYWILDDASDLNKDSNYAQVCLLGVASVRQGANYKNAKVGDYVVPDNEGCAILSDNGVGFRVVSVGQYSGATDSYWNYKYVDIALVPQNDNVARVMAELEGTKQNLGNLSIQIGKLEGSINNSITSIIPDIEETLKDMNGAISDTQSQLKDAQDALADAQEISSQAKTAIETAKTEYTEALSDAQEAITNANNSLADLNKIKEDLTVLDEYQDENTSGVAGFVAKVEKDRQTLATLNNRYNEIGNDITLINQKIDENGAAIEHLVAHADKYSVGDYSLTHNLTREEAYGLLGDGEYIYIPTLTHTEESPLYVANLQPELYEDTEYYLKVNDVLYSFVSQESLDGDYPLEFNIKTKELKINNKYIGILLPPTKIDTKIVQIELSPEVSQVFTKGKVYIWSQNPDTKMCWWETSNLDVSFSADAPTVDLIDGYLWYTHNGWRENDVWIYEPRTLYRYSETKKIWVAVARANDGNTRTMSFINQTAKDISSTVTNLGGDVSTVKQTVGEISSTVSEIDGDLTRINQTAEAITLGASSPNKGMSSLEILLNGMRSVSSYDEHVLAGEFGGSPASGITTYTTKPKWTNDGFSFEGATETTEITYPMYYFDSDKKTYYCEQVDSDTYKIYTLGNKAMANISSRVDKNAADIALLTQLDSGTGTTLAGIQAQVEANTAQISSIAAAQNVICAEVKPSLTEDEKNTFNNATKYSNPPAWNVSQGKFEFTGDSSDTGVYCITNNTNEYYKIIPTASDFGYERYILSSTKLATIEQKVDDNGASISMVVDNNGVKGGVVASAINNQSEVYIGANKIAINGTTTFSDILNPNKTAISGDYIKTGILASNNYAGPLTYKMYGAKVEMETKTVLVGDPVCNFTLDTFDYIDPDGDHIILFWDTGIIGVDLNIESGEYYYSYQDKIYPLSVQLEERVTNSGKAYTINTYNVIDVEVFTDEAMELYPGTEEVNMGFVIKLGTENDSVYYTSIADGTLNSSIKNQVYYYADKIEIGASLSISKQSTSQYYVSQDDFDLIFADIETQGTKFDLNNGTIYSKNFELDRGGNLSITGKITATSGYIGDSINGFAIGSTYISNNQITYQGDTKQTSGVYVGVDGIGLGNGRFYVDSSGNLNIGQDNFTVDSSGNLTTLGDITMKGKGSDGTTYEFVTISNGNLTLGGNITLSGNITWDVLDEIQNSVNGANSTASGAYGVANNAVEDVYNLAHGDYTSAGTTFISGKSIYSPNIYAGSFTTVDKGSTEARIVIDSGGINSYNASGQLHGLVSHPNSNLSYNDGFSFYSGNARVFSINRNTNNVNLDMYSVSPTTGAAVYCGQIQARPDGKLWCLGNWHFSGVVTGLNITFG